MLDLIIKNGSCYIDGKLIKSDIAISKNKISNPITAGLNSSMLFSVEI